jgi:hypothetical protein
MQIGIMMIILTIFITLFCVGENEKFNHHHSFLFSFFLACYDGVLVSLGYKPFFSGSSSDRF